MFNPFTALRQTIRPSYLGVDIGTTSIKVVELERGKQIPRLVNYAALESQGSLMRTNRAFQTSTLKIFEDEVAEFLALTLHKMQPTTREVVASIPNFAAFMTPIRFPKMSPGELAQSMVLQAKQYIPMPISEVAIDWITVGEYKDENDTVYTHVFLIAVEQEQIRRYQHIFARAGLSLRALEVEALSVARALTANDPTPALILDIGSRATSLTIAEAGQPKFTSQSDFAGASLTQAISESLAINPLRAEELKRERGIMNTAPNYELSTIMAPFLDATIQEVRRALASYETQFSSARKVERIILTGGGANLLGIEKYFAPRFTIPVVKATPLARCEHSGTMEPIIPLLNPLMSVAVGLALRNLS